MEQELIETKAKLEKLLKEQQESAKLLIRRDLALTRANEKLQALDVAKSEFISIAAHQLRTPLSAIKWILSMAVQKEFLNEDETGLFLAKAYDSCERMIHLVNDLLAVDHIESGKDQFIFRPVDVRIVIESIVAEMGAAIEKKELKIAYDLAIETIVEADTEKIRAVFQNLIENAVKYTPNGGTLTIGSKAEGKMVTFFVKDTGIGITKPEQATVFTKFFRAKNALKVDTLGSGLGLFIAKQIVERHGGALWFESVENQGSTFFVSLPKSIKKEI